MNKSRALQIITPSGNPNGLKVITAPGWSGRCYIVHRQSVKEMKELPDNNRPGLYILFGQDETTGQKLAYVGESENFFGRVTSHDASKDFWDTAVIFTGELNRAYVKYLEHRATLLASEAKRMIMQNKVQPAENSLSDYDKVAVEQFFEQIQFVLGVLGYELFETIESSVADGELYFLKGKDFNATARLLDNGNMLVLAGSVASKTETGSFGGWSKAARVQFLQDGKLKHTGGSGYEFAEDILFQKPSPAAAVVAARSINGWTAWKDGQGNTLDQIREMR